MASFIQPSSRASWRKNLTQIKPCWGRMPNCSPQEYYWSSRLPRRTPSATGTSTCPLSKYMAVTPDRSALFQFASRDFLTRAALTHIIQDLLKSKDYALQSFRIAAATSAAAAGIPEWLTQVLGHWSSQCYQSYIKTLRATIQAALEKMAKTLPAVAKVDSHTHSLAHSHTRVLQAWPSIILITTPSLLVL